MKTILGILLIALVSVQSTGALLESVHTQLPACFEQVCELSDFHSHDDFHSDYEVTDNINPLYFISFLPIDLSSRSEQLTIQVRKFVLLNEYIPLVRPPIN